MLSQVALSPERQLVLALCGSRLHAFSGGPSLKSLFSATSSGGSNGTPRQSAAIDLPTRGGAAQLQLLCPPRQPTADGSTAAPEMPRPEAFAVLAPSGIYYGRLDLDVSIQDPTDHLIKHQLLPISVLPLPAQQTHVAEPKAAGERPLSLVRVHRSAPAVHTLLLFPCCLARQHVNQACKHVLMAFCWM